MNIFKRIFKINETVDHLESSINNTEQGISDMKIDLLKSEEAMSQAKVLAIRSEKERDEQVVKAKDYESKAMLFLKRTQAGQLEAAEADRLAKEALAKKEDAQQHANRAGTDKEKFDKNVSQLKDTIDTIKGNITNWENELRTLKARVKVSDATRNVNKQMAELDSAGTVSMLERMKEKLAREEAIAEDYGDLATTKPPIDDKIDAAADPTEAKLNDDLVKLKEQLGIKKERS